jgi:hypothetical protein
MDKLDCGHDDIFDAHDSHTWDCDEGVEHYRGLEHGGFRVCSDCIAKGLDDESIIEKETEFYLYQFTGQYGQDRVLSL